MLSYHNPEVYALFFIYSTAIYISLKLVLSYTVEFCRHHLRHSHASLLIELGYNILLISERLGHENTQTTLGIYSHLYPNVHENLASGLNDIYSIKTVSKTKNNVKKA